MSDRVCKFEVSNIKIMEKLPEGTILIHLSEYNKLLDFKNKFSYLENLYKVDKDNYIGKSIQKANEIQADELGVDKVPDIFSTYDFYIDHKYKGPAL
jgi:hypothetical protein